MLKQSMPPSHPGELLKLLYMEPLGLTVTELAENLGVSRKTVSQLINGHMGISAEMAIRLSKAFNTTPQLWLNMQQGYDLWNAKGTVSVSEVRTYKFSAEKLRDGHKSKNAQLA